jgi:hypothetical protein
MRFLWFNERKDSSKRVYSKQRKQQKESDYKSRTDNKISRWAIKVWKRSSKAQTVFGRVVKSWQGGRASGVQPSKLKLWVVESSIRKEASQLPSRNEELASCQTDCKTAKDLKPNRFHHKVFFTIM